jgi:hypothetical protein
VRWRRIIISVAALLIINVPFATSVWQQHRAATDGIQVTGTVVQVSKSGSDALVDFRMPASVDPKQPVHEVKVDGATGAEAARTQLIHVRVLKGHPSTFHVAGQVRSWGGAIVAGVADVLVLSMLVLSWRLGGRIRRPALVAVALGDVETGEEGSLLDKQADGSYLINGEIAETGPESMVLTLRDRDVTVHLQGYDNPVAVGQLAQVRAHLVG